MDGDWDRDVIDIESTSLYRGLTQRFVEGREWLDTELRRDRYQVDFDNAPRKYAEYSLDELVARGVWLDELYARLGSDGYRPHWRRFQPFETELAVNIGRRGDLFRNSGGLHRLIIAQLLGLPHVPVRLVVVHAESEWNHPVLPT